MINAAPPAEGALFDLTSRGKLRVTGADRFRFLNGQISNDLRRATAGHAIRACVLNAKGKVNADIFIAAEEGSFLIDVEREMREQLAARLERYVIADDVQIVDVTDEFALFHATGHNPPPASVEHGWRRSDRLASSGFDVWVPRALHETVLQELASNLSLVTEPAAEVLRIERGIPRWGHELTEEIIPTEANLEASAIDYAKGCYIGQEVVSRIKMSGQTNKRLCGFVVHPGGAIAQGMRLLTAAPEAKDVGWISSVAQSERLGKQIALGFVKRGFQTSGTELQAVATDNPIAGTGTVEIVPLPFV